MQAQVQQGLEGSTLGRRTQHLIFPGRRIVHIAVIRCDVVVAQDRELRCD